MVGILIDRDRAAWRHARPGWKESGRIANSDPAVSSFRAW